MRNVKKFLALVLAMLMVVSAAATVSAFEDVAEDNLFAEAIADLTVLEIVNGYDGETFGPEDAVTRQQFALMMARAITGIVGDDAVWAQGGLVGFEDVTEYQYAIATVVKAGIVDGFLDNTFRPDEGVTFIQALKMAVAALGYDDGNLDWWQGYYNVALDLGLTKNLNQITDADKALNRGEVAQLVWNMLYAPAANGSSLAYDVFGIGVEEPIEEVPNAVTFVIVATEKQYAKKDINVAEKGFVGVQELVNGVPAGEVEYIALDAFGFESDAEAEEYFLDSYNFLFLESGELVGIEPTNSKMETVYVNTEITETAKTSNNVGKLTIDGVNYYMVEELTGTPIRNEVVIFNRNGLNYEHTVKHLVLDRYNELEADEIPDGLKVDATGSAVVLEYVGNGLYRDFYTGTKNAAGAWTYKPAIIDEEDATAKYGIPVVSTNAVPQTIMTQADLVNAYQLIAYDENGDGKMDRAYYVPVYVGAYKVADSGGETFGPMNDVKDVTYTAELAKGDVFKYTYNPLTKVVDVIEKYDIVNGQINRINATKNNATNNYTVYVTIDGVEYVMGTSKREAAGLDGFKIYNNTYKANAITTLLKDGVIGYTFDLTSEYNTMLVGDYVRFVAVEDTIIAMEEYDMIENSKIAILEGATDFDNEAIYVDMWIDGELVKDVPVTGLWLDDENVEISDMNYFELGRLVSQFGSDYVQGDLFRVIETEIGYRITQAFDWDDNDYTKVITDNKGSTRNPDWHIIANEYKLGYVDYDRQEGMRFEDGEDENAPTNAATLITDSNTIFYFIETDAKSPNVYTFTGSPRDGATLENVTVYADKVGYRSGTGFDGSAENKAINDLRGTADVVVVYYSAASTIRGFNVGSVGERVVYITEHTSSDYYHDHGYASDDNYKAEFGNTSYYYYASNIGFDMHTGAKVSGIYAPYRLTPGTFYVLDEDNIVVDEMEYNEETGLWEQVKTEGRYGFQIGTVRLAYEDLDVYGKEYFWTGIGYFEEAKMMAHDSNLIDKGIWTIDGSTYKISALMNSKNRDDDNKTTDEEYDVWYLLNDEANDIFVGVVCPEDVLTIDMQADINAKYDDLVLVLLDKDGKEIDHFTLDEDEDYYGTFTMKDAYASAKSFAVLTKYNSDKTKWEYASAGNDLVFKGEWNPVGTFLDTLVITAVEDTSNDPKDPTWTANTSVVAGWGEDNKAELAADFDLNKLTGDIKIYVGEAEADNSYDETKATVAYQVYDEAKGEYGTKVVCGTVTASYEKGVLSIEKVLKKNTTIDLNLATGIYKVMVIFDNAAEDAIAAAVVTFEMSI